MKFIKLVVCMGTLAMAIASAASRYNVTFHQPAMVNGTELKAGEYKVEVNGNNATISAGKVTVQAPVRVESSDTKYNTTSVRYATGAGNYVLDEIHVGGTKTKLVFDSSTASR